MKKMTTVKIVLCALFAALTAALSQLTVVIGPVPINLAHISVFLAAGLLGAKYGWVSQLVFVLLGAFGLPVFSGFRGGLAHIAGPTGGFIAGYILCALVSGLIIERFGRSIKVLIPAMAAGMLATYFLGVLWFMVSAKATLLAALAACVAPFLLFDAAKIVICALLVGRLYPVLSRQAK